MGYDSRAIKIDKPTKMIAILTFNKERERHYIREMTKVQEKAARTRTARNRGDKDEE